MRYLGLDLGTKTCGVAISDRTNTLASFLKVIRFNFEDYESIIPELKEIIKNNNITQIALGLPKNMDNSCGFAAQRSMNFKKIIEENINIKVNLVDERLTTTEAENILIGMDKSREKRKKVIDGVAATLILESFIREKELENGK
ncbi:MAG: Holliday junction resolvase RuvX [Firmicutes bacterium]|nr:Holliday junction resolvase RuvX [Bacillota bacterium]